MSASGSFFSLAVAVSRPPEVSLPLAYYRVGRQSSFFVFAFFILDDICFSLYFIKRVVFI